jgi:hypothetical protein
MSVTGIYQYSPSANLEVAPKLMNVATCATPAIASSVQVPMDVSSRYFDAIATPTMRTGNARNMSGAKNIPRTFGWTNVDAQMISANDGAVSINAVERRMLRV